MVKTLKEYIDEVRCDVGESEIAMPTGRVVCVNDGTSITYRYDPVDYDPIDTIMKSPGIGGPSIRAHAIDDDILTITSSQEAPLLGDISSSVLTKESSGVGIGSEFIKKHLQHEHELEKEVTVLREQVKILEKRLKQLSEIDVLEKEYHDKINELNDYIDHLMSIEEDSKRIKEETEQQEQTLKKLESIDKEKKAKKKENMMFSIACSLGVVIVLALYGVMSKSIASPIMWGLTALGGALTYYCSWLYMKE